MSGAPPGAARHAGVVLARRRAAVARDAPGQLLVIGHRGACAQRPEHTASSYALAVAQGADGLDIDVVATADGELVVRHDDELSTTTDVARRPDLAGARTTRTVDGVTATGWFSEDLTAAQVRSLRAVERLPLLRPASAAHDGAEPVMTLDEVLALRAELSRRAGREVAAWVETKHPTHSAVLGLPLEQPLLEALGRAGLRRPGAPVAVQSFEPTGLRALRAAAPQLVLVQLVGPTGTPPDLAAAGRGTEYADLTTPAGLAQVSAYADVLAPALGQVHPRLARERGRGAHPGEPSSGCGGAPSSLVQDAHAAGLLVVPYTLRPENTFLPVELRSGGEPGGHGDVQEQARRAWAAGVDGLFSDAPDVAVASRARWLADRRS